VGAGELGELRREAPHAAAGAGDEHTPSEHRPGDVERLQSGQTRHGQRRGLCVGDGVGQLAQGVGGDRGKLGPRPGGHQADDPCPARRTGTIGGGSLDRSGEIPPGELPLGHVRQSTGLPAVQ
jgi:hypothetical protein